MPALYAQSLATFVVCLASLYILAKLAPIVKLLDYPDERKRHSDPVPVVGGIALYCTLLFGAFLWGNDTASMISVRGQDALWILVGTAGFLVVTGVADDRFQLGITLRAGCELLAALAVIELLDLRVVKLGDLLGIGVIRLPSDVSYIFTAIGIFGVINAFNMLDGLDGALASLVIATLVVFHLLTETPVGSVSLTLGVSLLAFLISNLSLTRSIPKTFLGDAGSRLLGFIVVCLLLAAASDQVGASKIINPVTTLYLVALPLCDMTFTTLRRIIKGRSPFLPDRTHIHHLLEELGFPKLRALGVIVITSLAMNLLGLTLHRLGAPERYQMAIFMILFAAYCFFVNQAWFLVEKRETADGLGTSSNKKPLSASTHTIERQAKIQSKAEPR